MRLPVFKQLTCKKTRIPEEKRYKIKNASGKEMKCIGTYEMNFKIGNQEMKHKFIITPDISRSILLGNDFLSNVGAVLDFAGKTLKIGSEVVSTMDDADVTKLCRLASDVTIAPNQAQACYVKLHGAMHLPMNNEILEVVSTQNGILSHEPGITTVNSFTTSTKRNRVPIVIVNNTNRHFTFHKGNVITEARILSKDDLSPLTPTEINLKNLTSDDMTQVEVNAVHKGQGDSPDGFDKLNIADPYTTQEQKQQLQDLLAEFDDAFSKHEFDLGVTNLVTANIKTGDSPAIKIKPYRTPMSLRGELRRQIDGLLKANIISPSRSPWSAPCFFVPKPNNKVRLVINFDPLNKVTEKFYWPLTSIDDILANLHGCTYFSTIDFSHAYHQLPLNPEDRSKAAFVCEEGLYEFNYLAFGLTNAPSIFSQLMDYILHGIKNKFATSYIDDVLVFSKDYTTHLSHLREVLTRIRDAGLKMNKAKCEFLKPELKFLGHSVSKDGLRPLKEKTEAISNMPPPTTHKGNRAFIGVTSYYRRYIDGFSRLVKPLLALNKKHAPFIWTDECQKAFDTLKDRLCNAPVLAYPDFSKPFALFTDASDDCIGGALTQVNDDGVYRPIHYLSHKLSDTQTRWSVIEKELYAIVFSLQRFKYLLYGHPFKIYTDHAPLTHLSKAAMSNPKLQRWAVTVSQFGGEILYIKGKLNLLADFLSRPLDSKSQTPDRRPLLQPPGHEGQSLFSHVDLDMDCEVQVINSDRLPKDKTRSSFTDDPKALSELLDEMDSVPSDKILATIGQKQYEDPKLRDIILRLRADPEDELHDRYVERDGRLHLIDKKFGVVLVVPPSMKSAIIKEAHIGFFGAHLGPKKLYQKLVKKYYWRGMYRDSFDFCDKCIPCHSVTARTSHPPIQGMPVPPFPFAHCSIDTMGPLPETMSGNKYVITYIDLLTGWLEVRCSPTKETEAVGRFIMEDVIPRHSCPLQMTSDNGTEFVSEVIEYLTKQLKIHHIKTSFYNPEANGAVERSHRTIREFLMKLPHREKDQWDRHIPSIVAAYRCADHESKGSSPFELLYGREPVFPLDTLLRPRPKYYGESYGPQAMEDMHRAFTFAKARMEDRAKSNRDLKNKNAKEVKFEVGDPVFIVNHDRQTSIDYRYTPHYRILKQTGPFSYVVKDQLTGGTKRLHARELAKAAECPEWGLNINPSPPSRPQRKARYVQPPSDSEDTQSSDSDSNVRRLRSGKRRK